MFSDQEILVKEARALASKIAALSPLVVQVTIPMIPKLIFGLNFCVSSFHWRCIRDRIVLIAKK